MPLFSHEITRTPQRAVPKWPGWVAAVVMLALVVDVVGPHFQFASIIALVIGAAPAAWMLKTWWKHHGALNRAEEIQLALTLMAMAFVGVELAATHELDFFPLLYLILAMVVTFQSRTAAILSVSTALVVLWADALIQIPGGVQDVAYKTLLGRSAFMVLFGVFAFAIHAIEVLERRRRHQNEVEAERESIMQQARAYRLLSSGRNDSGSDKVAKQELITRDAVDAINQAVYVGLSLLKTALDGHTVILLWSDVSKQKLAIKELVSDSDHIIETSIEPAKGVIGGVTRRREPVRLDAIRPGFRGIPYYRTTGEVKAFVGIPVLEGGHLRGVLCVDRVEDRAFTDQEIEVANETIQYILRAIENERAFSTIEKSKNELSRFFEASRRLNNALTPTDVYSVALECAQEIVPFDFAAITLFNEEDDSHEIVAVEPGPQDWVGHEFESNSGLVSMTVKNRHYLPYGGVVRDERPIVFERDHVLENMKSMLVLPLIVQDKPIGTFIIATERPHAYSGERREMLEVIANQVAVTLQNARLYKEMREMATTDGLTGLDNHRTFQRKLEETIARHRRANQPFGLLLTDIDHFKSVNDTYGHPVGDEVLRQVAATFRTTLRETDIPARYGGEEFAIILENTDLEGCEVIANRLREEIKKLVFHSDKGPFSCTISMGLGHWPIDTPEKQELIDFADQALYHSKKNGRDRVTPFQAIALKAS